MIRSRYPMEDLLIAAKSAALHKRYSGYRNIAARDADLLRYPKAEDHGEGKVLTARTVRILMRCLNQFGDSEARALLAEGMVKIVDAIRAEPDRPAAKDDSIPYWMQDGAA